jgi:hypothetical protein
MIRPAAALTAGKLRGCFASTPGTFLDVVVLWAILKWIWTINFQVRSLTLYPLSYEYTPNHFQWLVLLRRWPQGDFVVALASTSALTVGKHYRVDRRETLLLKGQHQNKAGDYPFLIDNGPFPIDICPSPIRAALKNSWSKTNAIVFSLKGNTKIKPMIILFL